MLMNRKAKTVNVLEGPITESCAEFPARHVFIKCPECRRVIDEARLHDNLDVCPRCGKHFRVSGRDRMRMTVDEGTFEEWDASLAPEDFLSFPGYADKLKSVSENSELQLDVLANDEFLSGMYHTDLMGHLYADE